MIQKGNDISIHELAEQITQCILSETFLNKDTIKPRVKSILKAYIKKVDAPKHFKKAVTQTERERYTKTIHKERIEKEYWRGEVHRLSSEDTMKKYYAELDEFKVSRYIII